MARPLNVHCMPSLVAADELAGGVVVVIDVLRASSTIAYALAQGAAAVIPCLEVPEAFSIRDSLPSGAVLGGERAGVRIDGFDLGNSPEEYSADRVDGKTVVFTTTNGTRAMQHAKAAKQILIGSFLNYAAVAVAAKVSGLPIHFLCAGTNGRITREDVTLAGCLTQLLVQEEPSWYELNDQASLAAEVGRQTLSLPLLMQNRPLAIANVLTALTNSIGGRNLIELNLRRDLEVAAQVDLLRVVPALDVASWRISPLLP